MRSGSRCNSKGIVKLVFTDPIARSVEILNHRCARSINSRAFVLAVSTLTAAEIDRTNLGRKTFRTLFWYSNLSDIIDTFHYVHMNLSQFQCKRLSLRESIITCEKMKDLSQCSSINVDRSSIKRVVRVGFGQPLRRNHL